MLCRRQPELVIGATRHSVNSGLKGEYDRLSGVDVTQEDFQDEPPGGDKVTEYDRSHLVTYLRLLDAETEDADWKEVARIVFRLDPAREPDRAKRIHDSHLARAHWMTENGYRDLIRASYH
jgi:hypothetical protein